MLEPVIEFMPDKISGCPISYRAVPILYRDAGYQISHVEEVYVANFFW